MIAMHSWTGLDEIFRRGVLVQDESEALLLSEGSHVCGGALVCRRESSPPPFCASSRGSRTSSCESREEFPRAHLSHRPVAARQCTCPRSQYRLAGCDVFGEEDSVEMGTWKDDAILGERESIANPRIHPARIRLSLSGIYLSTHTCTHKSHGYAQTLAHDPDA